MGEDSSEQVPQDLLPETPWYLDGWKPLIVTWLMVAVAYGSLGLGRMALGAGHPIVASLVGLVGLAAVVVGCVLAVMYLWNSWRHANV